MLTRVVFLLESDVPQTYRGQEAFEVTVLSGRERDVSSAIRVHEPKRGRDRLVADRNRALDEDLGDLDFQRRHT